MNETIATATQAIATATPELLKASTLNTSFVLIAAALCIAIGAAACAIAQGRVIAQVADGIARQPEAANDLRGLMILGLAMIESLAIYCLLISLLLVFMKS